MKILMILIAAATLINGCAAFDRANISLYEATHADDFGMTDKQN